MSAGPLEREVRECLSKSSFQSELGDEARAAGGAGNGGTPSEIDVGAFIVGILEVIDTFDEVVIRLAAEIDRLRGHDEVT